MMSSERLRELLRDHPVSASLALVLALGWVQDVLVFQMTSPYLAALLSEEGLTLTSSGLVLAPLVLTLQRLAPLWVPLSITGLAWGLRRRLGALPRRAPGDPPVEGARTWVPMLLALGIVQAAGAGLWILLLAFLGGGSSGLFHAGASWIG